MVISACEAYKATLLTPKKHAIRFTQRERHPHAQPHDLGLRQPLFSRDFMSDIQIRGGTGALNVIPGKLDN